MTMPSKPSLMSSSSFSDDDDFQIPLTRPSFKQLSNARLRPAGKENLKPASVPNSKLKSLVSSDHKPQISGSITADIVGGGVPLDGTEKTGFELDENSSLDLIDVPSEGIEKMGFELDENCSLDLIESSFDCSYRTVSNERLIENGNAEYVCSVSTVEKGPKTNGGYLCNSVESRLMTSGLGCALDVGNGGCSEDDEFEDFEAETQLDELLKLCSQLEKEDGFNGGDGVLVQCPVCGTDISVLREEQRQFHTNECLDKEENPAQYVVLPDDDRGPQSPGQVVDGCPVQSPRQVDVFPVLEWLRNLGLTRYEEIFVREEIDWDTLQWLTEEDLFSIGVTALGPRKRIVHALSELRKVSAGALETRKDVQAHCEIGKENTYGSELHTNPSKVIVDETSKLSTNKLITDYFPGSVTDRKRVCTTSRAQRVVEKSSSYSGHKRSVVKNNVRNRKLRDIPLWCCIPGTLFRVDAFRYLRGDCSHWFLTHFHMDHYQGLTRSFSHGKIYCSLITAKLINMKIGIPWDKIQVLPLNQKICIAGIQVTCLDANHCPGSIIILFEPPDGKAVLHTGDFRFSEEMTRMSALQMCSIHTLILDTTYCKPQYDFPKQDAVIQFVIEAIQAEAFNPKTLFLIGSYTIGKERLFLEVARVLRKRVYVTAAKLRILKCLGFSEEDMQWFTINEHDSHIHVVPMWTLASFKRLKHISNQYVGRFSLIVAFSPTGWAFGKGKKKSPGRRWQQGTIIRYEVPYSEHSNFTELKECVKFISPVNIIPSVNNDGPDSANAMVSLLLQENTSTS